MKNKCTYIGYRSDAAAARRLKEKYGDASALEFLLAIAEYGLDQHLPTFVNPSAEDAFYFADIQRRVDADVEKYATTVEKRRMAGQSGGIASGEARSKAKQNEANEANASKVKQTKQMLQSRSKAKQNEANEANASKVKQTKQMLQSRSKVKQNEANEAVSVSVSESVSINNSLSPTREEGDAQDVSAIDTETSSLNTETPLLDTFPPQQRPTGGATTGAGIPTLEEVLEFAKTICCPESLAIKFFNHYEANGWVTDGMNPRPFRWQNKLMEWKVAEESKPQVTRTNNSSKKTNLNVNDEYAGI